MQPRRLRPFDASFLALDGPTTVGHVCLLSMLDGPVALADLRAQVGARLHLVPPLRRRLAMLPLGLDRPWWVDDDAFDLDAHLSETTLPPGSDEATLADQVGAIAETKLDRARPLWKLDVINGLPSGQAALVTTFHHCLVDGLGSRDLMGILFGADGTSPRADEDDDVADWRPGPLPSPWQMAFGTVRTVGDVTASAMRIQKRSISIVARSAGRVVGVAAAMAGLEATGDGHVGRDGIAHRSPWITAPETPFNHALTSDRSCSFGVIPVPASARLRRATGTKVNDVMLAVTAGALRQWLLELGALPAAPLVALVPIGVETASGACEGNHLGLTLCPLPTHLPDPRERLDRVHQSMLRAKTEPALTEALLTDLSFVSGPSVTTLFAEVAARVHLADRIRLPFNLMVSNVPSARQSWRVAGRIVTRNYPFPPLSDGLGLTIAVVGYGDVLGLGLLACPVLVPDVWRLRDLLLAAHDELLDAYRWA
ncbi:MAG TPA: wax ester/triacylglycerol synthase family O-acyltransferase [Candidatus Lustribacter sp.]|nr:wax ester/triacylglycerol synthase family O-acyltransferase [Candidatus Lustribacter sp.]